MTKYAVFGNPIKHSKSPQLHNGLFKKYNINSIYEKVLVQDAKEIRDYIIKNNLKGANITLPFKEDIYYLCDELSDDAKDIQAVNTILYKNNKLIGYNTDGDGFMESIDSYKGIKTALMIGAGGASKSVALALKKNNIKVMVANRSHAKLEFYKNKSFETSLLSDIEIKQYDLIINTTSVGLETDDLPIKKEILEKLFLQSLYIVDIIYGKETSFLKLAKAMNKTNQDGAMMLVMQGVYASMIFADINISFEDRKEIMKDSMNANISN